MATNLKKYPFNYATIGQAGSKWGLEDKASFDKILVADSTGKIPKEIVTQLAVGGTLMIPIGRDMWQVTKISATQH